MKRFHYVDLAAGGVEHLNRLLSLGWQPLREVRSPGQGAESADRLIAVLEREDHCPVYGGEVLVGDVGLMDLSAATMFAGLTGDELREVVAAADVRRYAADDVIFSPGENEAGLYTVLHGLVHVELGPSDDDCLLHAGPFETLGESSFFAGGPHTARAVAKEPTDALHLTRDAFNELLQAGRSAATKLAVNGAALLGSRLQAADNWVRELVQDEENSRIARSWKRYRQRVATRVDTTGGFFGIT